MRNFKLQGNILKRHFEKIKFFVKIIGPIVINNFCKLNFAKSHIIYPYYIFSQH